MKTVINILARLFVIAFVFILIVCAVAYVVNAIEDIGDASCKAKAQILSYNYEYTLFTGCFVEVAPEQWLPFENITFEVKTTKGE